MTNLDANHYRKHSLTQYTLAHEMLRKLSLTGNETILDVGCGDGRITAEIAKCVPEGDVIGIDPSMEMIELAKDSFQNQDYPHLSFIHGLAEELHDIQLVDIILVMNALHWVRNPIKAIHHFAAALKPNGSLFVLTYPKESPYWAFLEQTAMKSRWQSYIERSAYQTMLTSAEYTKIIENSGLVVEEHSLEEKIATYTSSVDLIAYVKGWLNCYLPLPQGLDDAFLQEAAEAARCYSLVQDSEEIQLPYLKLILKARKEPAQ